MAAGKNEDLTAGTAHTPTDGATPLAQFAGYETLGVLGVGGMGVVYQARQTALNRTVAIKTLRDKEQVAPHELERFRFEAEIVAQFQHPNIVQLYHIGDHDGRPFLAFEYVEGGSLARRIRETPLPPREAAALVEILARAVHAAHLRGVIHRDLTPNNVLLAADGTPRIADFGLAQMQERSGLATDSIAGTASYMAPEQAWGEGAGMTIGPATDVYGLGAILYELICGRPPFKASSSQKTLAMVYRDRPVPPHEIRPDVPPDLELICLKCLEKDPAKRFASAETLADELQRFLAGKPLTSRRVSAGERLLLWSRRNPLVAAMTTGVGCLLIVSLVLGTLKLLADQRAELSSQQRADALYRNQIMVARSAWESGDVGRAIQVLNACSVERRSLEWYLLRSRCRIQARDIPWTGGTIDSVVYSPQGNVLAVAELTAAVRLIDPASGKLLHTLAGFECRVAPPNFSPDGTLISAVEITGHDYHLRVWEVSSGKELQKIGPLTGVGTAVEFSADSSQLISVSMDNVTSATNGSVSLKIETWDRATGKRLSTVQGPATDQPFALKGANVAISPDGRWFAWTPSLPLPPGTAHRNEVQICETATGKVLHTLKHPAKLLGFHLAFSPDSTRLVTFGDDSSAILWDVSSGVKIRQFTDHADSVNAVAFSADGKRLATGSLDYRIIVHDLTGGDESRELRASKGIDALALSPDGAAVASADLDERVVIWELNATPVKQLVEPAGITGLCFSINEKAIMYANVAAELRAWKFLTSDRSERVHRDCLSFAFSPDQAQLAIVTPEGELRIAVEGEQGRKFERVDGLPEISNQGTAPLVFSPDGELLACLAEGGRELSLIEAKSRNGIRTLKTGEGTATCLAFRSDGKMLAVGTDAKTVQLFNPATGEDLGTIAADFRVHGLAFRPMSHELALLGRQDNYVQIVDSQTLAPGLRIEGHKSQVTCMTFTGDGRRLVTGGADRMVRIWDADTAQELLALADAEDAIGEIAVDTEGRRLAAAVGLDLLAGKVVLWNGEDEPAASRPLP